MSLVSEALRKARQEGKLREARRFLPSVPLDGSGGRHRGVSLALVLAVAFAAAAGGGSIAWLLLSSRPTHSNPAEERRLDQQAGPIPGSVATAPPAPAAATATSTSLPPGTPIPSGVGGTSEQPPVSDGDRLTAVANPEPAPVQGGRQASQPVGAGATEQPKERVFVLDADLGYAKLHLDYLVYKPSAPFGSINGQYVAPGSVVAGFRVDEFGEDFIRLSDAKGALTLRVR